MPIYVVGPSGTFPPQEKFSRSGLVAIGGDLSVGTLLKAYLSGLFPWYNDDEPICWWSPDPRGILRTDAIKVRRSLRKTLRKGIFEIRMDTAFDAVIHSCAALRKDDGTWLHPEMQAAYTRLHALGIAHSVETWLDGRLVGGLYGVSLGKSFSGESMFSLVPDASKVALVALCQLLRQDGVAWVDCQTLTEHLRFMGGEEMPRAEFLSALRLAVTQPTRQERWPSQFEFEPFESAPPEDHS